MIFHNTTDDLRGCHAIQTHRQYIVYTNVAAMIWWRHQMATISALLAPCAGNSPATGEFPSQRPVTRSFDVLFDLRPNGWLNNHDTGDLKRHRAHYDVTVMNISKQLPNYVCIYCNERLINIEKTKPCEDCVPGMKIAMWGRREKTFMIVHLNVYRCKHT